MNIYILTGEVHSGKTTALESFCAKNNIKGILSPVRNGRRFFKDISSGHEWPMETEEAGPDVYSVGKYRFSRSAFHKAEECLEPLLASSPDWIVIDEIGPLELDDKGFAGMLNKLLLAFQGNLLLVIRRSKLDEVTAKFKLDRFPFVVAEHVETII